jgi:hypothetical protein
MFHAFKKNYNMLLDIETMIFFIDLELTFSFPFLLQSNKTLSFSRINMHGQT